jgi:neutral ceramidase
MARRAAVLLCALLTIVPSFATVPGGAQAVEDPPVGDVFEAGAGEAEITPPIGTSMWGYTAREGLVSIGGDLSEGEYPRFVDQRDDGADLDLYGKTFLKSEGVHSRLYSKAHVFDDGDTQLATVFVDLGGVPGELHQAVADRLADRGLPIDRSELLVSASHTHGGPGEIFPYQGYALLGGGELDPRVFGLVADQITASIVEAWEDKQPAEIAVGQVELEDATTNRAEAAHTEVHDDHAGEPHVDETARVIRVDAKSGEPIGIVTQFAAHGTVVGADDLFFTADNQGVAYRLVERGVAALSPSVDSTDDVVVGYLNGAEGDVSPNGDGDTFFEQVEDAGQRQAGPILREWLRLDGELTSDVDLDTRFKFTCFCGQQVDYRDGSERLSPIPILGAGGTTPEPVRVPGHGDKTPLLGGPGLVPNVVRLQVVEVSAGEDDHLFATMPGEPTMAAGLAIEEAIANLDSASDVDTVDVVGLANDYVSYMTRVPEYEVQAYEGTFTLYGRMTNPMFRHTLVDVADKLLRDEPVDPGYEDLVEHPNLPLTSVDPLCEQAADSQCVPTGAPPNQALHQPRSSASAGDVVEFAWLGGRPGVDHPLGEPMVEVVDDEGNVLVDDEGFTLRVFYDKVEDEHRWRVEWPVDEATPEDTYTIRVDGQYVDTPGHVAAYSHTSQLVTVS